MQKLPKQKIYVELDCLLDTRIGTVAMISQDLATSVLKNGYHQRDEDVFPGVDKALFDEMYKNRSIDTLKVSTITTFMPLLNHLCGLIHEEALMRPYHSGPHVVVNIYPYYITGDIADDIREAVSYWLGPVVPVEVVRIEPKELKPRYCKEFSLMVMYDPTIWFNETLEDLIKAPLRDVALYVPQLYRNKTQTNEEIEKLTEEVLHPFAALELLMKSVVDVSFLEPYYFSLFDPKAIVDFSNFKFSSIPDQAQPNQTSQ